MATAKYKKESPFVGIDDRHHHSTDWKYEKYTKFATKQKKTFTIKNYIILTLISYAISIQSD